MGMDGSDAICTTGRSGHWTGPAQDIDSRCLSLHKNEFYEFSAYMKVTEKDNPESIIQTMETDKSWWRNLAPQITINGRSYRDESTKEHM